MDKIVIETIKHSFSNKSLLNCGYTVIHPNVTTGIVGLNGCGKSTLFKILYGTIKADYHRILYKGNPLKRFFTMEKAVAFLPQDFFLPKYLKVKKFISLAQLPDDKAEMLKQRFSSVLNNRIISLSGGEKRMLEIFYIFSLGHDYILLDEPFIGLEPKGISEVKSLIRNSNSGVIITSHLYKDFEDVLDEILLLKNGNLIKINSREELCSHGYLPG